MSAIESVMVSIIAKRFACLLSLCPALAAAVLISVSPVYAGNPYSESESNLVRVTITTERYGARDALAINGQLPNDYNPVVIEKFSSTGIVLDRKGYIMSFLGYGKIFVQKMDSRFEIDTNKGQRYNGRLVGIDQGNGAAVIHVSDGELESTQVCSVCDISDGTTVIAPVLKGTGGTQFQETQILSIRSSGAGLERESWVLRMNRPFLGVGQPILTNDGRVLGFIVSQDQPGLQEFLPVSALLSSAEKIIKKNGDIRTGWLGVGTPATNRVIGYGTEILSVDAGSPAQKAGLIPSDIVLSYNERKIEDVRQFIHLVQDTPVGSSVTMEILRGEHPMTLSAVIQPRPFQNRLEYLTSNLQGALGPVGAMIRYGRPSRLPIGFGVIGLTPALAAERRIQRNNGLLVVDIAKQTPADLAGIKDGDVILSINEQPVNNAEELSSYLQSLHPGSTFSMKVLRRDSQQTISVQLPGNN